MMEHSWKDADMDKQEYSEKNSPITTLSTKNPTTTSMGSKPGLCSKRLVNNCLKHRTAQDVYEEDISMLNKRCRQPILMLTFLQFRGYMWVLTIL
jgi:hypothetical protein